MLGQFRRKPPGLDLVAQLRAQLCKRLVFPCLILSCVDKQAIFFREGFSSELGSFPVFNKEAGADKRITENANDIAEREPGGRFVRVPKPNLITYCYMLSAVHGKSYGLTFLIAYLIGFHVCGTLVEFLDCFAFECEYFFKCVDFLIVHFSCFLWLLNDPRGQGNAADMGVKNDP